MHGLNKVELVYASAIMTKKQFREYSYGDILLGYYDGDWSDWKVIRTWDIADYKKAIVKLYTHNCDVTHFPGDEYFVQECALFTYREENGEFLYGGEFKLADNKRRITHVLYH